METESSPSSYEIEGRQVSLPVEVRTASSVLATWLVPTSRASAVMGQSGLEPYGPLKGRALVSIGMVRYIDSDLGPYNEFALAFVVKRDDVVATLIHQLPVNQPFTLAAGRGIWGFPKFLTTSTIGPDRRGHQVGTLAYEGESLLSLDVAPGIVPIPARTTELDTYSYTDGVLRRTPFTMRTASVKVRPGGARLTVGRGHQMADDLAALSLGRPISVMHVGRMSATFGAPEVVSL